MRLRHFSDNQRIVIKWEDPKVVLIEPDDLPEVTRYAYTVEDKLAMLRQQHNQLLVAWPGETRTDVFELDDETRSDAIDQLQTIQADESWRALKNK